MASPHPERPRPGVDRLCRLAGLSRASYYRHWQAHAPRQEETDLRDAIQRLVLANRRYGHRRIAAALRQEGRIVNPKRVLRLMREDNLLCLPQRPFVPVTTDSRHDWHIVPNRAAGLVLTGLDQLWVGDLTYVRLAEGFAYLAVVLDAFSRKVVGWAMETHLRAELAVAALKMAITARTPKPDSLIHHSDRGVQYACRDYCAILEAHAVQASMSRAGNPYDNAKAESFMKTLKHEEVCGYIYRDVDEARRRIVHFIENVYNPQRLHSALGYLSPVDYETNIATMGTAYPAPIFIQPKLSADLSVSS
jgi:putative transposase